jgi:hypothetical protein
MGEHLTSNNPQGVAQNWRMAVNDIQPSMANSMTSYERMLTSNKPEQMPWHARFAMKTEMLPAPGLLGVNGIKGPGMVVSLLLQVSPREGQKGVFQEMVNLNLELETDAWKPAKLNAESYALLIFGSIVGIASFQANSTRIKIWISSSVISVSACIFILTGLFLEREIFSRWFGKNPDIVHRWIEGENIFLNYLNY